MAEPSIVQLKVARLTSVNTTLTCTFDATPTVGRLIVVFGFASGGLPTVADNQGNTYTQRESEGYAAIWGRVWTAPANTSSGTFTVTLTPSSGSQYLVLYCLEIANWNNSTLIEKSGRQWNSISSADSPYSPLNYTATTNAEQLFLTALTAANGVGRTYAGDTGWTTEYQYTAGDSLGGALTRRAVTSTGTYDPTFTLGLDGSTQTVMLGISLVGGTEGGLSSGHPTTKRLAGVPFASLNRGVW